MATTKAAQPTRPRRTKRTTSTSSAEASSPEPDPVELPDDDQPPPTNVIAALARVQQFVGGIQKLSSADHRKRTGQQASDEQGVKYAYRSIDQITARAQPLFGRYGIVIVPNVGSYDQQNIEVANKPWVEITMTVHWTIYGPSGLQDMIQATTIGVGRDNSDKGANKAMTSAYKNLVLRLLTIGDPDDDADHERHETSSRTRTKQPTPEERANTEDAQRVFERVVAAAEDYGRELGVFGKANGGKRFGVEDLLDADWRLAVETEIDRLEGGGADADALGEAFDESQLTFPEDGPDPREVK